MSVRVAVELRSGGRNQDRAQYFTRADSIFLALADGAGGLGDGARAAERVIAEAKSFSAGAHGIVCGCVPGFSWRCVFGFSWG